MTREYTDQKRRYDRERVASLRAAMTAEERAEARRESDRRYRDAHRAERRQYDLERQRAIAAQRKSGGKRERDE